MTDQQIIDMFDQHPNLFLSDLARMTGKTIPELKKILLESPRWN